MQITNSLCKRFNNEPKSHINSLVGICGRAGSGKSLITKKIINELRKKGIDSIAYSGDWRFILDSEERRLWLQKAEIQGINSYLHAINQFKWWDFDKISCDLSQLVKGQSLKLERAYNRTTGKKNLKIEIPAIEEGIIFYESAILGHIKLLQRLHLIIIINTPDIVCLKRIIMKDIHRRTAPEIAARFLLTTYSENLFFNLLIEKFQSKTLVCNDRGELCPFPEIKALSQIPVSLECLLSR